MSLFTQEQLDQITNALVPGIVTTVVAKLEGQTLPHQDEDDDDDHKVLDPTGAGALRTEAAKVAAKKPKIIIIHGRTGVEWVNENDIHLDQIDRGLDAFTRKRRKNVIR